MNRRRKYRTYTPQELQEWIPQLCVQHRINDFYNSHAWRHLRAEVLHEQHYECQVCRRKGLTTPADTVHHIKTVRQRPDLALTKSNCMAVCSACHWDIHHPNEHGRKEKDEWNDERW